MYKTVIIEDDSLSLETLKDTLMSHFHGYEITGIFSGVQEAIKHLPHIEVDLVLLDMELGDGLGFDVLRHVEEINFEIIITTMHNNYMLEAIKHAALDYLLKPILKQDLELALARFEQKQEKRLSTLKKGKPLSRLAIPNQNGFALIEIKDIVRLESDGAYTKLFIKDGSIHLASKNLGFYEDQLVNNNFSRVHHKHLINMYHVKNYMRGEGGSILMSDGSSVEVSRRKKEDFLRNLES